MRPPFPYLGSKVRLSSRIISLMGEHTHYVEPFAGSCAVLLAKPRSVAETVNDLSGDLVNLWRVIRDKPQELAQLLTLTPHSPEEYYGCVHEYPPTSNPVERARRTLTILWQGISRTTEHGGMWGQYVRYSPKSVSLPMQLEQFRERIQPVADRLVGVTLENRPALEIIRRYGREPSVLLYCDPPYALSTRSGTRYVEDMTDSDHEELLDALTTARAQVLVSGYRSTLYDQRLSGWERFEFSSTARGRGVVSVPRTEVIWRKPC